MAMAHDAYAAFLFDLDGTVADSMPLHLVAWQQAAREFGGEFPAELFWSWGGIPLPRTVEMLNEQLGFSLPVSAVVERKEGLYLEMLDRLQPVAEVVALLRCVCGQGADGDCVGLAGLIDCTDVEDAGAGGTLSGDCGSGGLHAGQAGAGAVFDRGGAAGSGGRTVPGV